MRSSYFKLTSTITDAQLVEQSLGGNPRGIIANQMQDKRGLLRGTIEERSFPVRSKSGKYEGEYQTKKAFVCARTGYVLTLDLIAGCEDQDIPCEDYQKVSPTFTGKNKMLAELTQHIIDRLPDFVDSVDVSDLHNEIFNTDYYVVGYYNASKLLESWDVSAWECIEEVQEYERFHFGETNTKINSESMTNMLAYIKGEEILFDLNPFKSGVSGLFEQEICDEMIEELTADLENYEG